MSLDILFHFLCTKHVSDINISIISSLRLCCWITTLVVLFLVWCVSEFRCGWFVVVSVLQAEAQPHQISNTQRTENKTTDVVIQQHSRKLLMMDILMSETCWVHKKWNKISSDIKLVFYSSAMNFKLSSPYHNRSAQRCACVRTHTHTSIYTRVHKHKPLHANVYYIYIYICVCVCVCLFTIYLHTHVLTQCHKTATS